MIRLASGEKSLSEKSLSSSQHSSESKSSLQSTTPDYVRKIRQLNTNELEDGKEKENVGDKEEMERMLGDKEKETEVEETTVEEETFHKPVVSSLPHRSSLEYSQPSSTSSRVNLSRMMVIEESEKSDEDDDEDQEDGK